MLVDPDWPYLGDDWCEYQHLDKASEHSYCKLFLQETCDYKILFFHIDFNEELWEALICLSLPWMLIY